MKPFVIAIALVLAVTPLTPFAQTKRASAPAGGKPFTVVEASISEMRTAMEQGRTRIEKTRLDLASDLAG